MAQTVVNNKPSSKSVTNKYKYIASLKVLINKETVEVDPMYIKSIVIDYDYINYNMPLIYLTVTLDNILILKLLDNQDTATIMFNIQRYIMDDPMQIKVDYIKDEFIYFISDNLNIRNAGAKEGQTASEPDGNNFTTTTIGLMSLKLVNNNKKTTSGVVNKTTMMSLAYHIIGGELPLIMEPFKYNKTLNGIILPPLDSKAQTIKYLNNLSCFYDTQYRYFMDFDAVYLISTSGTKVPKKNDKLNDVLITLSSFLENDSKIQGMILDTQNNMYKIYISDGDCEKIDNKISDKSFTKVVATSVDGTTSSIDLTSSKNKKIISKSSSIRLANDNTAILKNMQSTIDNSTVTLVVTKTDIDSSVLSINKRYIVEATEVYGDAYNAEYLLNRKRELYIREDENLIMDTILTLNKIGDSNVKIG